MVGDGTRDSNLIPYLTIPWTFHTSTDSALFDPKMDHDEILHPPGRRRLRDRICKEGTVSIVNAAGCRLQSPACTVDTAQDMCTGLYHLFVPD